MAAAGAKSCGSAYEFSELAGYAQQKDWKSLHQNDTAAGYAHAPDTLKKRLDTLSSAAG